MKLVAVKAGAVEGDKTEIAESNRKALIEEICWPPANPARITVPVLLRE